MSQRERNPDAYTASSVLLSVDGYRPGDRDDFDRLYRNTYPRLLRVLYAITGDAASAEDCVQEAYMRAFAAWGRYRPDSPAEAWMHQIAVNTAISYRRRAKLRSIGAVSLPMV